MKAPPKPQTSDKARSDPFSMPLRPGTKTSTSSQTTPRASMMRMLVTTTRNMRFIKFTGLAPSKCRDGAMGWKVGMGEIDQSPAWQPSDDRLLYEAKVDFACQNKWSRFWIQRCGAKAH